MLKTLGIIAVAIITSSSVSGCGVLVGAGAAVGTASMEERGISAAISDKFIQATINSNWLKIDPKIFVNISSQVHEGRVLLSGNVVKPQHRVDAVRVAWQVDGVREVINQIKIRDRSSLISFARDGWVTTQLTVKLTVDSDVKAINYSIDTVDGHVFIMGIAQDQKELDRVLNHAHNVSYVRRVTNHVILKNDPARLTKIIIPKELHNPNSR
ncbi:MAG: hypothetical protein CMP14_11200 [Rickettsiales bacterium]|nr:hypothetical protein [Rickettsiales bacterium]